jgi:hypothetical protein
VIEGDHKFWTLIVKNITRKPIYRRTSPPTDDPLTVSTFLGVVKVSTCEK